MFDPRPLCCSSLTTAVGGTTDTNFVDSAHPTVERISILHIIYTRDHLVTESTSLYRIGPGSQVYNSFLGEFPMSHGDKIGDEHCFSSSDKRSIREDHPNIREHAMRMVIRSTVG